METGHDSAFRRIELGESEVVGSDSQCFMSASSLPLTWGFSMKTGMETSLLLTLNMHQGVHPSWHCPTRQAEQTVEKSLCFQWRSLLNRKFAILIPKLGYWSFICRITTFNLKYSFARTEKICCQTYCRRDFVFPSTHPESNLLIKQLTPQSNHA